MSKVNDKKRWLEKGLAATLSLAGAVEEAATLPIHAQEKGPPVADVKKAPEAPKGPRYGNEEFDQLKPVAPEAAMLETILGLHTPFKGLGALIGAAKTGQIQAKYALVPPQDVERGKWKDFQKAYDEGYKFDRLPAKIKTPTKVGVFVIEHSPLDVTAETPFAHGHSVTAAALAAGKAITGNDVTVHLMNAQVFDGRLGKRIVRTPEGNSEIPDVGHGILRANYYDKNSVNVISVSMVGINRDLKDRESRLRYDEQLTKHFGDNAVFVVSSGNGNDDPKWINFKHNALRHHPHTLVIGAANQVRMEGHGNAFNAYSVTDYSTSGADVLMPATPSIDARYAQVTDNGIRHMPFGGTSSSTPQAAGGVVGPLFSRFVASKENPQAVLKPEDVVLAIKNTAQPIHAAINSNFKFDTAVEPPTAIKIPRKAVPVTNDWVAGHYASKHGNGMIDVVAAWNLLEKQEKAVRDGNAKVLDRQDEHVSLSPKEQKKVDHYYSYELEVKKDLYADQVFLDLVSKKLGKKILNEDPNSRPRLFLTNPAGEMLEIEPSSAYKKVPTYAIKGPPEELAGPPYIMARAPGMQGSAMKGKWTLQSSEPLDGIDINFYSAMQPGHVAVTIRRDPAEAKRNFYRHADFTAYTKGQLDKMLVPDSPMLKCDLSETGFPAGYTDLRLIGAVKNDKQFARDLVEACYGNLKNKGKLLEAVESGDGKKVLDALVPAEKKLQFFKTTIRSASAEDTIYLVQNGFGKLQEEVQSSKDGKKRFNTALHEYVKQMGKKANVDVVKEFLKAGADAHTQDAVGRTPLHWARHHLVQKVLMEIDLNGPQGTRVVDILDDNGRKGHEVPWNEPETTSMAPPDDSDRHVSRLSSEHPLASGSYLSS